ncbi:MAG: dihydrodipicolinate reductase, partial [Phycisphaeraceae bacterium]
IDAACRRCGVACVGTGVNPGYLMDFLPATLSTVCQRVDRLRVWRVQDASKRRGPFQKKIGAGLSRADFREQVKAGAIRHVGLLESVHMVAAAMDWQLDEATESIKPVIAERRIRTKHVRVEAGEAAGVEQIGKGKVEGREVIRLVFRAAVSEPESYDTVKITGEPSVESTIAGGVNGDIATCAVTLNVAQAIVHAPPGLHTMLDLPGVHYRG